MLGALFKPAWQSKSADKRKQFILELSETGENEMRILKQLIHEDENLEVRKLALQKITNPSVIFEIIKSVSDGETRDAAVVVFSKLTGAKSALSENEFRNLIRTHSETTLSITKTCPFPVLRLELLNALTLEEQIDLLADIEYSDTRVFIAEKIESLELLEKARQVLKGKDKNAEKIIKTKLHDLHAAIKKEQENLEVSETLCDKMEYLASHTEWRSEFKDRYQQCNRQWNALDFTPNDYLLNRYNAANTKVTEIVNKYEKIQTVINTQKSIATSMCKSCDEASNFDFTRLSEKHSELSKRLEQENESWKKTLDNNKPEKSLWKEYENNYRSLNSLLNFVNSLKPLREQYLAINESTELSHLSELKNQTNKLLATLEWSKDLSALQIKTQVLTELEKINDVIEKQKSEYKENLDKLHKRINRLQGSTKRGNLAQARRELSAVIKLSEEYTGKDKTALDERLEKATESVDKMADWKDYATAPKFIELCEAMQALSPQALKEANKANMHPDKLAAKIAELQKNWKALGHSDSADEHWERFSAAGDIAYAPCAEFFKQRQETRKKNLEKREPLVKEMQDLVSETNWSENSECKKAEISIRKITEAWKKIKDVEPGPGTKQWKRLRKAKNAAYEKLTLVYASNLELKKNLINKAKELLELDIKEDSLKKLQSVQGQWKEIGLTKRKDDQKAWQEFKVATDAVFAKIQGARKAKRSEEDEHLKGPRDIIKGIQKLSKTAKNLAEADSSFEKFQSEYAALPPLPRGLPERLVEGISKDYKRACGDFNKSRERIIQKSKHQALDNLAAKAALCSEYEALSQDAAQEELDDLLAQMEALEISDNELRKRFAKRLEVARNSDREKYTENRKLMCIDLEILLGKDSPSEDKAQRMKIQLERMQKGGFGQERVNSSTEIKRIKLDWYCSPGAEPAAQIKLEQRFKQLIK